MSHLSSGGDSFRLVSEMGGSLGLTNGYERRADLPASVRATDPDFIDTACHEAGHALVALGLGWTIEYCDAIVGQTRCLPPRGLSDEEHDRQLALIAAGAAGFSDEPGSAFVFGSDVEKVRALDGDWNASLRRVEAIAEDRDVQEIYTRIVRELVAEGRLEHAALERIWND